MPILATNNCASAKHAESMNQTTESGEPLRLPNGKGRFLDPFGGSWWGAAFIPAALFFLEPGIACGLPATRGQDGSGGGEPRRIVFIDAAVPDRQILADGVQPGTDVVVLDPSGDGVSQIASYRQLHQLHGLESVSIVAHGSRDELRLGETRLNAANVGSYGHQLAEIGAALGPAGSLLIYGCDVAAIGDGDRFLTGLAAAAGAANVSASSHLVGSAAKGGGWILDAKLGAADAPTPFTDAALAAYPDLLTTTPDVLWYTSIESASLYRDTGIFHINVNGTAAASGAITVQSDIASPVFGNPTGAAIDPASGYYFVADSEGGPGNVNNVVVRGNLSGGAPEVIFTTGNSGQDFISGIAFNPANSTIYVAVTDVNFPGPDTGIYSMSEIGAHPEQLVNLSSGTQNPDNIAIDVADNLLFFTNGYNGATVENVEVVNLSSGTVINSALRTYPTTGTEAVAGIAVDPVNHKLYWTTVDTNTPSNNATYSASYSTGASVTLFSVTTLFTTSVALAA
jgi:hypothetical protein